ncbi:MAG TPA: hypothetical protein VET88_06740 [Gammaproteobacteria bacterium]|nr:hypothetical protein [Gammaproteobacteria bacterium]
MSINFETLVEGDLLKGRAWDTDDSLEEVQRYGMAIVAACLDGGCSKVLLDERELQYGLDVFDTYDLADYYSEQLRKLLPKVIKAAIVFDPEYLKECFILGELRG